MNHSRHQGPWSWHQVEKNIYERNLTAAEDRWDSFHRSAPTAWTDFCSAAFFHAEVGRYSSLDKDKAAEDIIRDWAYRSVCHLLLRAPLLMGRIETNMEGIKKFAYTKLASTLRPRKPRLSYAFC